MVGTDDYMLDYDTLMNEERENVGGGGGVGAGAGGDGGAGVEQIWFQDEPQQQPEDDDLSFIDFPALIADHFPCMYSSSSSSTPSSPAGNILSASAVNNSETEEDRLDPNQPLHAPQDQEQRFVAAPPAPAAMEVFPTDPNGGIFNMDCMDDNVMLDFSFMDLMDEEWDPTSLLQPVGGEGEKTDLAPPTPPPHHQNLQSSNIVPEGGGGGADQEEEEDEDEEGSLHDLGVVFLEWLKSNKEHISAAEMRNIKLNKATVECASKNLGTTREGKKQLLKLILQWVEQSHLRKRRMPQQSDPPPPPPPAAPPQMPCQLNHFPNPPTYPNHAPGLVAPCYPPPPQWLPTPQPFCGGSPYLADPYSNMLNRPTTTTTADQYRQLWQPPQFIPNTNGYFTVGTGGKHKEQYYNYPQHYRGERLTRPCSSATKEARQKRMARHRRIFRHNHHHHQQSLADNVSGQALPAEAEQNTQQQKKPMAVAEQRQEWKNEKNLKFLLQKVLKQSDVGNLGRIVLPKKEAEAHLPELDARDGIPLAMEDIGTSRVWKLRYRYWPNNKSRMYLLENTGGFVRANRLQEGDFIVIYSDLKCGKYLIRGVKVPQSEQSQETEKVAKSNKSTRSVFHTMFGSQYP